MKITPRINNTKCRQCTTWLLLVTFFAVLAACAPVRPGNFQPPSLGERVLLRQRPTALVDITTGNKLELRPSKERSTLVLFWASWCPACRAEIPKLAPKLLELEKSAELRIVQVSLDHDPEDALAFVQYAGLSGPVLFDGARSLTKTLQVQSLPGARLLKPNGEWYEVQGRLSLATTAELALLR